MSRLLVVIGAYLLSWLGSALIHVVDSDVGSVQGLGDPSVLLSVSIVALILFAPVLVCCAAYLRGHWRGFAIAVAAFSIGMGFIVSAFGFGGWSVTNWILALVGMSALIGLVLVVAALPMIWIVRVRSKRVTART